MYQRRGEDLGPNNMMRGGLMRMFDECDSWLLQGLAERERRCRRHLIWCERATLRPVVVGVCVVLATASLYTKLCSLFL